MKTLKKFLEQIENLEEKNVPTSPEKWARAKAAAKSKFAVYPSAYANGWASKKYKAMGGGWKSVGEEVEQIEEGETIVTPKKLVGEPTPGSYAYERKYGKYTAKGILRKKPNPNKPPVKEELEENHIAIAMGKELDDEGSMAMNQLDSITRSCEMLRKEIKDPEMQLPGWVQSKLTLAADYMETVAGYMSSKNEKTNEEVEISDEMLFEILEEKEIDFEQLTDEELMEVAAWQRKEGKSKTGGLNRKGIASYRRENPGSKLSMAVTTPPSKLDPNSKAAKRRKSFCARMGGMPGPMKKPNGEPTRKALSLRKWNC